MSYKNKLIPLDQIETLTRFHQETIPESYLDAMGHMNVQWYVALFDKAVDGFFASFGMDSHYFINHKSGAFALQQFIHYLAEVHVGETVAIYIRIVALSAKRLQFVHFMVNETTGKLAAIMEVLCTHTDLELRRASPFPPDVAAQIEAILAEHNQLDWQAPLSGTIKV